MLREKMQSRTFPATSVWQHHKSTLLVIALLGSLQACGGGSGGGNSAPTPVIPTSYAFSLTSTLTNKCGEKLPFVNAELFIQNSDWSIVEELQPDANGVFRFSSDNELINYTIVAKTQQAGETEGVTLLSFHQANAAIPAMYQAQHSELKNKTNCECVTKNVSVAHATITNIDDVSSSTQFEDVTFVDSRNTVFNGVEVCRIAGDDWPLHSFSVVGEDNNNELIGRAVFIDNVFGNEAWQVSAFESSTTESLGNNQQAFSNEQRIDGRRHFLTDVKPNDASMQIFRAHDYIDLFRSEAEHIFEERPNLNEYLRTSSKQTITSEIYQDTISVAAETRIPNAFQDDRNMNIIAIKSDGTYDFSTLANFPMAIIDIGFQSFSATTNSPIPVSWITYGPIAGTVPINVTFPGYESLINAQTRFRIDSKVIQSASSNRYSDYVNYFQNYDDTAFENNVRSYQIILD
jgi:hypothetical protein